jgi:crotonobetainyl-CoA:carnitine CoA-transferase CaiB-like acyl-CoA transferase
VERLARVMGNPEWMTVDIFQDMYQRAQNADAIYPLLVEWTMEHGKREIMDRCQAEGVPVTAVFTVAEAAEHPHLAARGYLVELEHPALGRIRDLGAPFKLPASPGGPCPAGAAARPTQRGGIRRAPRHGRRRARAPARRRRGVIVPRALPLQGIRVANFGWVWAGPVVGQTLGFLAPRC